RGGPFEDFSNFLTRVQHKDLNKKSLESMIKAGVFDSFGIDRNALLLNIEEILSFSQNLRKSQSTNQGGLFGADFHNGSLKLKDVTEATDKEKLSWEKELLGLYISDHPLNEHLKRIKSNKVKPIKELLETNSKEGGARNRFRIAGVISKTQRIITKSGQPMLFATIEDFNDSLETIVFADALAKNPAIWRDNNALIIQGRLSWRNNEPKLICEHAVEL
ncbi:MAG: OB-fold nucleic acid binding domain-containing protein, partial [Candidatus Paceibacterota bacterium]